MSQCNGLPPLARVDMPRISTMDEIGGECVDLPGRIGSLNSRTFVTPYNVTYYEPGVIVREFNHRALRLPQMREFLGPEFFNPGCATLYGNAKFDPNLPNSATNLAPETQQMYESLWAPQLYFEGNKPPCDCNGIKCDSPNGPNGWRFTSSGDVAWQTKQGNQVRQAQ